MVPTEDDNRILVQAAIPESLEQLADLVVDVRAGAVVGATGALDGVGRYLLVPKIDGFEDALRVGILLGVGDGGCGEGNIYVGVAVVVLVRDGVGVVRMCEGDCQAKRTAGGGLLADMIVKVLRGLLLPPSVW